VIGRQAALIARWMQVGFIHGVMNTDNMAVSGQTIDYGPCAFMDAMDPATVFSSIDTVGRYAYANQPRIAQWNLARFAETLLPMIDPSPERAVALASEAINAFSARFEALSLDGMRAKLGLLTAQEDDRGLISTLLGLMHRNGADFTVTFRRLGHLAATGDATAGPRALFADPAAFDDWAATWQQRLAREPHDPATRAAAMRQVNPAFIPRNHLVEQALTEAVERGDLQPFERLLQVLARPYDDQPDAASLSEPAPPTTEPYLTFCGT
jgi:uncharacterized protein YdiU (UPF0061 family)